MPTQPVVVLDGYDGSGKTTLAQLLAARLPGRYLKAFQGEVGALVARLYATRQFDLADLTARMAIRDLCDANRDAPCLIFDRHWVTMFALLPERYYSNWGRLPKTFLCWTNAATTLQRLASRGEEARPGDDVAACCALYRRIAQQFGATIVDTTHGTPDEALSIILDNL